MSNASSAANPELADRLLANTASIVARSLEYMPKDAFWEQRYAERAKRFANEDGAFHVRYLADAVRISSSTVMAEYACWLRDLLVPRGMCTLHLSEHLEHIGRAVVSEAGGAIAAEYVARAIAAMRYDSAAGIIQDVADTIGRSHPGPRPTALTERHSAFETRYLCHYVADAWHRSDAGLLARHVSWSRERFLTAGGAAPAFDGWIAQVDAALRQRGLPKDFLTCPSDT